MEENFCENYILAALNQLHILVFIQQFGRKHAPHVLRRWTSMDPLCSLPGNKWSILECTRIGLHSRNPKFKSTCWLSIYFTHEFFSVTYGDI